jgi:hypothetical protein
MMMGFEYDLRSRGGGGEGGGWLTQSMQPRQAVGLETVRNPTVAVAVVVTVATYSTHCSNHNS